jgi:hypothetical protein
LERVSSKLAWQNIGSFPTSLETFCNVYGPQFHSAELDVASEFERIFLYNSCATHCRWNQQLCWTIDFKKCQSFLHFILGQEVGRCLGGWNLQDILFKDLAAPVNHLIFV